MILEIKANWSTVFLNMFTSFLYMFWVTIRPSSGETTAFMRHFVLVILSGRHTRQSSIEKSF